MKREHVIEGTASIKFGEYVNIEINAGTEEEQELIVNREELMDLLSALTRFTKLNYESI